MRLLQDMGQPHRFVGTRPISPYNYTREQRRVSLIDVLQHKERDACQQYEHGKGQSQSAGTVIVFNGRLRWRSERF